MLNIFSSVHHILHHGPHWLRAILSLANDHLALTFVIVGSHFTPVNMEDILMHNGEDPSLVSLSLLGYGAPSLRESEFLTFVKASFKLSCTMSTLSSLTKGLPSNLVKEHIFFLKLSEYLQTSDVSSVILRNNKMTVLNMAIYVFSIQFSEDTSCLRVY